MKNKIRKWLGLPALEEEITTLNKRMMYLETKLDAQLAMAADINFNGNSLVVLATRLNGGQVRIINPDIKNYYEFMGLYSLIAQNYGRPKSQYSDITPIITRGI